jgi:hypothetical protein
VEHQVEQEPLSRVTRSARDGALAGLLAGTVLAGLFYFYDLGLGRALQTPAFLFGALTGRGDIQPSLAVIAAFTGVHYLVWVGLGILANSLIDYAELPRNLLIGAVYGLFACSIVFYAGLVMAGTDVLSAPSWPAVFFGNAVVGMVMFTHLHWLRRGTAAATPVSFVRWHRTLRHGFTAGIIGALAVAVWFLVVDSLFREPLYTPAALGTLLLRGGGGPADISVMWGPVVGYTVLHFAFFILAGVILDGLTGQIQRFPPLAFGLVILFVVFETLFVVMTAVLGSWLLDELDWWSILLGNLVAAVAMGLYVWKVHPALPHSLRREALWGH